MMWRAGAAKVLPVISAAAAMVYSGLASAQSCTPAQYPYTLQNGAVADAGQVTANLNCAAVYGLAHWTGDVGVGTTSPAYLLHVSGGLGTLGVQSTGSNASYIQVYNTGNITQIGTESSTGSSILSGGLADASVFGSNGAYAVQIGTSNTVRMTVTAGGNVGVGTASPGYLLTVNGTVYATGGAGALSDLRHKDQVQDLPPGALGLVEKLRPVSFVWKTPTDAGMRGRQIGLIAQEVETVIPSVVLTQDNPEKTKAIKYDELIPVLIAALKEQQAEIKAQQHKLEVQQADIDQLKARLADARYNAR